MALMLVLLLIVMVTAAGVFAAQSTAFEIRSSGFLRQATQTHYVAQTGVIAALDEMKAYCPAYMQIMRQRQAMTPTPAGLAEPPLTYSFEYDDFTRRFGQTIFAPRTPAMGGFAPGSLGTSALMPGFMTTTTVLAEESRPQVGFGVGGGRDFYVPMMQVEFSSLGRTSLQGVTNFSATRGGNVTAAEQARVTAQVPCL
jgi:hypothetical protein